MRQKKALSCFAVHLARDNLTGLVSNFASNEINKFGRKISRKGAVRVGKRFTLFISNKYYEWYYSLHITIKRFKYIN